MGRKKIYYGVVNPPGAEMGKNTTFLDKKQLKQALKVLPNTEVRIDHFLTNDDGKEITPCGRILEAYVHPKTGELWASFVVLDTLNGEVAHYLIDEKTDHQRLGLSLGYDFMKDPNTDIVQGHRIKELSICQVPCRKGTYIKGAKTIKEYLGIKENKNLPVKKEEKKENPNESHDQNEIIKIAKMPIIEDKDQLNKITSSFMSNDIQLHVPEIQGTNFQVESAGASMQVDTQAPPAVPNTSNTMDVDGVDSILKQLVESKELKPIHLENVNDATQGQKRERDTQSEQEELYKALVALTPNDIPIEQPGPAEEFKIPQNLSVDEIAQIKKTFIENNKLKQEVMKMNEAKRIDIANESAKIKDDLVGSSGWLMRILNTKDENGVLKPAAEEFLNNLVRAPGPNAQAARRIIKAAASVDAEMQKNRAADAITIERNLQEKMQVREALAIMTQKFKNLQAEVQANNQNSVMFSKPSERYTTRAPAQVQSVGAGQFARKQTRTNGYAPDVFNNNAPLTPEQRFEQMSQEAHRQATIQQKAMYSNRNFI